MIVPFFVAAGGPARNVQIATLWVSLSRVHGVERKIQCVPPSLAPPAGRGGPPNLRPPPQFTTSSSGRRDSASHPASVTSTVWPVVMARPAVLSKMMMWMKNTMPGAAGSGLP